MRESNHNIEVVTGFEPAGAKHNQLATDPRNHLSTLPIYPRWDLNPRLSGDYHYVEAGHAIQLRYADMFVTLTKGVFTPLRLF